MKKSFNLKMLPYNAIMSMVTSPVKDRENPKYLAFEAI